MVGGGACGGTGGGLPGCGDAWCAVLFFVYFLNVLVALGGTLLVVSVGRFGCAWMCRDREQRWPALTSGFGEEMLLKLQPPPPDNFH